MNKFQIQSAIFNLQHAIKLAKFYHNIENILPEHRCMFEEIGENSELIFKYVEETKDLKIAKKVASLERGWLYYLRDKEDNLSPMMVSIRKCCRYLLRISNSLNAINEEEQISINIAELESCFKRSFIKDEIGDKEKGDEYETNFEHLIIDLQKRRTTRDYARIALIIHESKKINATIVPKAFKQWYEKFCKITNCKFNENYNKRCKLIGKEFDDLKERLYYL